MEEIKINLDEGVSMPISLINQMRREAIELSLGSLHQKN